MLQAFRKIVLLLLFAAFACMAETGEEQEIDLKTADLGEIDRALNNPLTDLWSLTFQNNTSVQQGDAIDGNEVSNNLFFQPFLPFAAGPEKKAMLTFRPVFPLVTQPVFDGANSRSSSDHVTGLGDIQLLTLAGPSQAKGIVWGAGATFKFPTATDDALGQGKYQVGPGAMLFYMGKPWVGGVLAQHWNSVGGDSSRADTSQSDIQYIIRRSIPNAMSIGMGPTISINWEAEPENRVTLPIGLGITKTARWGSTPVKLRAEVHYSIIKPEDYGTAWNIRLQITPVINNPMKK